MSHTYLVTPLALDQIPQSFPLISIIEPKLDEDRWASYAKALLAGPERAEQRSILTVQSKRRHIYGLSVYWLKPDLREGRILEIENFAVVDVTGNRKPAYLLLGALEELARTQHCSCITISLLNPQMRRWLREPNNPAMDLFRAAGFRGEQLRMRKCF